ncbi:MAG: toll/interleukin-1 receptor domain-containing protein [Pseudomonadota bacterium]
MRPKVFVSHASEDKERFVLPFATALRARGVDAWVDKWEMLPGDSLVDKIFQEGIEEASLVIIVLSTISVAKPWVRQELNAAVVKRIENGAKLIPIVLDRCEVPGALKSTVWQSVPDTNDFSECLDRVIDSIFGNVRKPPLGEPSAYLVDPIPRINGLSAADSVVLSALYDEFLKVGGAWITPPILASALATKGIGEATAVESIAVLEHMGYAESRKTLATGGSLRPASISCRGVSAMLRERENRLVREVGLAILNDGIRRSDAIASALGHPQALVDHAVKLLADSGHLTLSKETGPIETVAIVSPTLRRALDVE